MAPQDATCSDEDPQSKSLCSKKTCPRISKTTR